MKNPPDTPGLVARERLHGAWSATLPRLVAFVALLLCCGCGDSGGRKTTTAPRPIPLFSDRIGEIPPPPSGSETLVAEYLFATSGEALGWQLVGDAAGLTTGDDGIGFAIDGNVGGIELRGAIDSRAIDLIEASLRVTSKANNRLVVAWRHEGELDLPISELINRAQYYKLHGLRQGSGVAMTVEFPVGDLDKWADDIVGLLVLVRPKSRTAQVSIDSVRMRTRPLIDRVTAGARGTDEILRMRLGAQSRPSLFAPPPSDWVEAVDLPAGAQLECGYAILESAWRRHRYPVRFSIDVLDDEGELITSHETVLDPAGNTEHRRWMDAQIDLGAHSGKSVDVRLRTTAITGEGDPPLDFDRDRLYAIWADPRIVPVDRPHRQPNVILISIDTLRADHLSSYGYPRATSPTLDRLTRQGTLFAATMSQAPETLPSHRSIMTGTYVGRHRSTTFFEPNARTDMPTIARALEAAGYSAAGFTEGGGVSAHFGFNEGFQLYDNGKHRVYTARERGEVAFVEETFGAAGEWLRGHADRPFFLFLHTYETHAPYWPEAPLHEIYAPDYTGNFEQAYSRLFLRELGGHRTLVESDLQQIIRLYDGCIRNVDREVQRLLALLAELDIDDNTLLVILSDHGEDMGDHFYIAKHGATLYEELVHVPMIFHMPGVIPAGALRPGPAACIDVFPTILDLLDLPIPDTVQGVSLKAAMLDGDKLAPRVLFSEDYTDVERVAARDPRHTKAIYSRDIGRGIATLDPLVSRLSPDTLAGLGKPIEAFDLVGDPAETVNLALRPGVEAPLQHEVTEFRRANQRGILIELIGGSTPGRIEGEIRGISSLGISSVPWPDKSELLEREGSTARFAVDLAARERCSIALEVLRSNAPFELALTLDGKPLRAESVFLGDDRSTPDAVPVTLTVDAIHVSMQATLPAADRDDVSCYVISRHADFDATDAASLDRETYEQLEMLGYVPDKPTEKPKD